MCGICGGWVYGSNTNSIINDHIIQRMSNVLSHRGPDDSGVYLNETTGLGLGFRRLSIIDPSLAGHQPMSNEDGTIWLVFNGEIYNFQDLRPDLVAKGHQFHSQTDSEVILHLYEERGVDLVPELNGMFAFAIWDSNRERLVLARDRVGKKPLYYYNDGQRFLFASELKAILADPSVPRQLDQSAVHQYLSLGYIPPPQTIFQNIHKLSPGHRLIVEKEQVTVQRYWDWLDDFQPESAVQSYTEDDWSEQIRSQLMTAVQDRLISDVPLGAFLSGGVDSSAVVASMAMVSDQPVKTFSIGFTNEEYNELPYARLMAEKYETEHHEYTVEPEALQDVMSQLAWQFDEPFADSSAVPTYYVSKMARQEVTVILSGDGGDEAFAGYGRYDAAIQEQRIDAIPYALRKLLFTLPAKFMPDGMRGKNLSRRMSLTADQRYITRMSRFSPTQLNNLLQAEWQVQGQDDLTGSLVTFMQKAKGLDYLSRMQYVDGMNYLPEDILVKVDRTSMLNSLEARCPLLDHRFMRLAAQIPSELRYKNRDGKYIFKQALQGMVPNEILNRQKMGFGVPLKEWFRDDLSAFAAEVLLDNKARERGIFRPDAIEKILQQHKNGLVALDSIIWTLLMFELWAKTYIDDSTFGGVR